MGGSWPRSKTRGAERLGSFEGDEIMESPLPPLPRDVNTNVPLGDAPSSVKIGKKEGDIVVTTKITTWCEDRNNSNSRSPLATRTV